MVVTYDADKQTHHVTVDGKSVGSKAVPVEIANEADIKHLWFWSFKSLGWPRQPRRTSPGAWNLTYKHRQSSRKTSHGFSCNRLSSLRIFQIKTDGKLNTYTVKEVKVPTHYTVDTEEASQMEKPPSPTSALETTTVISRKSGWCSNQDGLRPSTIKVHLWQWNRGASTWPDWWRRWMDSYLHRPASL